MGKFPIIANFLVGGFSNGKGRALLWEALTIRGLGKMMVVGG